MCVVMFSSTQLLEYKSSKILILPFIHKCIIKITLKPIERRKSEREERKRREKIIVKGDKRKSKH